MTTDSDDDLDSEPWDIELDTSASIAVTAVRSLAAERVQPIHRAIDQGAEKCLPCALLVCFCVPCVLRWWNPFPCCCRRRQCHSHPNDVPVPIDLFTAERMYSRPLAVVTYVCFTWQVFVAYFISIFSDWDIDEFYRCNDTRLTSPALDTAALLHYYPIGSPGDCSGFCWTNVLSELSGLVVAGFWTPLIFLVAIGIGNSRWHDRCWAFVAPVVALIPMWATISVTLTSCLDKAQKVDWNVSKIENHDYSNGFLLGGTIVSIVASLLYTMQFFLAVGVLVSRGWSSDWNSRRITHCGGAEYRELPITPLEPMSPQAKSKSSALSVRGHPIPQAIDSTGTMDALAETPLKTPLRFWIALALSELVVGTLFILFISFVHLYGHVMEDYARAVKGHFLDLNEVVADIANLNGTDLSGVVLTAHRLAEKNWPTWQQTVVPNFTLVVDQFTFENIVRSATLGGGAGLINELYWKYRAHRTIRKVIEMPQGNRHNYVARFDLFRAYYYVPFAVFNSAFAFAVVTFLLTLMSFIITPWNMFPPYTRSTSTLWTNVLLPMLLGPVLASVYVLFGHVTMKRVLFKGTPPTNLTFCSIQLESVLSHV